MNDTKDPPDPENNTHPLAEGTLIEFLENYQLPKLPRHKARRGQKARVLSYLDSKVFYNNIQASASYWLQLLNKDGSGNGSVYLPESHFGHIREYIPVQTTQKIKQKKLALA
jgi:hypothetical protein